MGVRLVFDHSRQVLAQVEREVEEILETGSRITQEEAAHAIQSGGRSGVIYKRTGGYHQASAKGEPPAEDTGALADSIQIERPSRTRRRVVVGEEYGAILELRKNRPFLLPAFYRSVAPMRAMLRQLQGRLGWQGGRPLRRVLHYSSKVRPKP